MWIIQLGIHSLIFSVLSTLLFPVTSYSEIWSTEQEYVLSIARTAGQLIDFPETLQAISIQESSAGIHLIGDDGQSFGPAQIQIPTARDALYANPKLCYLMDPLSRVASEQALREYITRLSDKRLRTELIQNHEFHFAVAAEIFKNHFLKAKNELGLKGPEAWKKAVRAYNAGWRGSAYAGSNYLQGVISNLKLLRNHPPRPLTLARSSLLVIDSYQTAIFKPLRELIHE